jgi:hypothetical protein
LRIVVISDSHTKENIETIYEYLKSKAVTWRPDIIIINGDVLGENEARENYGYNYNKTLFNASLDREKILKSVFPNKYDQLKLLLAKQFDQSQHDEKAVLDFANIIKEYVQARYDWLFETLKKFSTLSKTYFNIGTYESPLLYNVLKELAFLLDVDEQFIRKTALLTNYRDTFKEFQAKFKDPSLKKLVYIAGFTGIEDDLLIVGIPGFNNSTIPGDSMSEFQERTTEELMSTVRRQMSYATKMIILNQTQGKLRKDPFAFRPASVSVRSFIEQISGKMKQKVYVQSYHHFMTTHFYNASDFHFLLNNGAVNNCLFNMIEFSNKISCYDVDPKKDKIRKLNTYNYNIVEYDQQEARLALNYEDSLDVIKERGLDGCYYM